MNFSFLNNAWVKYPLTFAAGVGTKFGWDMYQDSRKKKKREEARSKGKRSKTKRKKAA